MAEYEQTLAEIAQLPENEFLFGVIMVSRIYQVRGKFVEALQYLEQHIFSSSDEAMKDEIYQLVYFLGLIEQGTCHSKLGNFNEAKIIIPRVHKQLDRIKENVSEEHYQWLECGLGDLHNLEGRVSWKMGDLEKSRLAFQQSLEIREKNGKLKYIAHSLNNLGLIHWNRGELKTAMDYFTKAIDIKDEFEDKASMAKTLNNIGNVLRDQGKVHDALKTHRRALTMKLEIGNPYDLAGSYNNMGIILRELGQKDKALEYFFKAIEIQKQVNNQLELSNNLFEVFRLYFLQGDSNKAKTYSHQLEQLKSSEGPKLIQLRSDLAAALLLQNKGRLRDKVKAKIMLEAIINQEIIDSELSIIAMFALCENLLLELKIFDQETIITEVQQIIAKIKDLAGKQGSIRLKIRVSVLTARIKMVQNKYTEAKELFKSAFEIANEQGLIELSDQIREEQSKIDQTIEKWGSILESNKSYSGLINEVNLLDYINEIQKFI